MNWKRYSGLDLFTVRNRKIPHQVTLCRLLLPFMLPQGLIDFAFGPVFSSNNRFYASYSVVDSVSYVVSPARTAMHARMAALDGQRCTVHFDSLMCFLPTEGELATGLWQ